jgi:hypothetical protein
MLLLGEVNNTVLIIYSQVKSHRHGFKISVSLALQHTFLRKNFRMALKLENGPSDLGYVGHFSCHSGSIPLFYNPGTTHISPQYHVVHDEFFRTVAASPTTDIDTKLGTLSPPVLAGNTRMISVMNHIPLTPFGTHQQILPHSLLLLAGSGNVVSLTPRYQGT